MTFCFNFFPKEISDRCVQVYAPQISGSFLIVFKLLKTLFPIHKNTLNIFEKVYSFLPNLLK